MLITLQYSPTRLAGCIFWFYLCLYCLGIAQNRPWMARKHRDWFNLLMLVTGPLLVFVLYVTHVVRQTAAAKGNLLDVWKSLLGQKKPSTILAGDMDFPITLLDMHGRGMASVLGSQETDRKVEGVFKVTENLIRQALIDSSTDILVVPDNDQYNVRLRIDGMMRPLETIDYDTGLAVVSSIKAISGMDISEKRRSQDGMFTALTPRGNVSFRVNSTGVLSGEKVAIRVLNSMSEILTLEHLGMKTEEQRVIRGTLQRQNGMILVCGPTGSGKSTTVHAMLRTIDCQMRNVITIEDPIEYVLPHASQIEVNPKADITFASALRSVLRQDPDVISVGEIRDQETAQIAMQASQTGHLVLATLHSNNNFSSIVRLLDFQIKPLLLSSSLDIVLSQRLLRKLCTHCKAPAKLTPAIRQNLEAREIDPSVVMEAAGCDKCARTGYKGRTGIYDLLVMDSYLKNLLSSDSFNREDLMKNSNQDSKNKLQKCAIRLLLSQQTSLEEIKRIITNVG